MQPQSKSYPNSVSKCQKYSGCQNQMMNHLYSVESGRIMQIGDMTWCNLHNPGTDNKFILKWEPYAPGASHMYILSSSRNYRPHTTCRKRRCFCCLLACSRLLPLRRRPFRRRVESLINLLSEAYWPRCCNGWERRYGCG